MKLLKWRKDECLHDWSGIYSQGSGKVCFCFECGKIKIISEDLFSTDTLISITEKARDEYFFEKQKGIK